MDLKLGAGDLKIVLNKMKQLGFIIQKDLSKKFSGSGALYFLFKLN